MPSLHRSVLSAVPQRCAWWRGSRIPTFQSEGRKDEILLSTRGDFSGKLSFWLFIDVFVFQVVCLGLLLHSLIGEFFRKLKFFKIVCYLFNDVSVSDVCLTLILHNPRCEYFRKLKFLCSFFIGGGVVGYLMTYQPQRMFECDIPYERMILFSSLAD